MPPEYSQPWKAYEALPLNTYNIVKFMSYVIYTQNTFYNPSVEISWYVRRTSQQSIQTDSPLDTVRFFVHEFDKFQ